MSILDGISNYRVLCLLKELQASSKNLKFGLDF